jgi:hypothetical protein
MGLVKQIHLRYRFHCDIETEHTADNNSGAAVSGPNSWRAIAIRKTCIQMELSSDSGKGQATQRLSSNQNRHVILPQCRGHRAGLSLSMGMERLQEVSK